MIVQFSAQIDSAKANNDRTLSLKVDTQELSAEDTAHIFSFFQKQIWIALAETSISKEQLNIPEVIEEMDKKSPSQRLRDRMFVYHKEKKIGGNFDDWYKHQLEKNYLSKVN
jgi:hypothetical protein